MNVSRMTRRHRRLGVATAIAAGAMVGASSTAANAAIGADTTYTCDIAGTPAQLPVHVDVPLLPGKRERGDHDPGRSAPGHHHRRHPC